MTHDLSKRLDYGASQLLEEQAGMDPHTLFTRWYAEAGEGGVREPSAMSVCTVGQDGMPSSRIVLLRSVADSVFTFFTNYEGRKGRELSAHPQASLLFFWPELERQVRVEGLVSRVAREVSEQYFASRPRDSQLGAWTSMQSAYLWDRAQLEQALAETTARFEGQEIPCPPHWGGYALTASAYEFWQGRPARLHDRLRYTRSGGTWLRDRLAP